MGYIKHDAIVVTGWKKESLEQARAMAESLELPVSGIVESPTNGYLSFFISPDGSKEGWDSSTQGDESRNDWIQWALRNKDLYIDWIHIRYGGDDPDYAVISDHSGNYQ